MERHCKRCGHLAENAGEICPRCATPYDQPSASTPTADYRPFEPARKVRTTEPIIGQYGLVVVIDIVASLGFVWNQLTGTSVAAAAYFAALSVGVGFGALIASVERAARWIVSELRQGRSS